MNILVNAISTREGGSAQVLYHLTRELATHDVVTLYVVISDKHKVDTLADSANVIPHITPWAPSDYLSVRQFYSRTLPGLAQKAGADVLFSMTNLLPPRAPCPMVLLIQNAGHFSREFRQAYLRTFPGPLKRLQWSWKTMLVKQSIAHANAVTVQTESLKAAIQSSTRNAAAKPITVIPHAAGFLEVGASRTAASSPVRIGYVSKFGAQKNFETFLNAIPLVRNELRDAQFHITLDPDHTPNRKILSRIVDLHLTDAIVNHGHVAPDRIHALYENLDIFVFPSFCESFGMPMVEAMQQGLPVVVADTPVNREVCDFAAIPFTTYDEGALAEAILRLVKDPGFYQASSQASLRRSHNFSWKQAGNDTLNLLQSVRRPR